MSRTPTAYLREVPLYRQGDGDALCAYYCVWMMRVAHGGLAAYCAWSDESITKKWANSGMNVEATTRALVEKDKIATQTKDEATAAEVWRKVVAAVHEGRPSVLRLPEKSIMHPEGHYVVVRGACCDAGGVPDDADLLIVNDPATGERRLSYLEFRKAATGGGKAACAWLMNKPVGKPHLRLPPDDG